MFYTQITLLRAGVMTYKQTGLCPVSVVVLTYSPPGVMVEGLWYDSHLGWTHFLDTSVLGQEVDIKCIQN